MEILFWILALITVVFILLVVFAIGFFVYILYKSLDSLEQFEDKY